MFITGLLALGAIAVSAPTMAQNIEIGPNGVRLVQPEAEVRRDRDVRRPDRDRREISEREAIRIARGEGLRDVDTVRRTDRAYRISGADRRGRDIQVVVDRRFGEVISVR
jgi:hypothetical protein